MGKFYICLFLSTSILFNVSSAQDGDGGGFTNCNGQVVDMEGISENGKTIFILHLPHDCKNCSLPLTQIQSLKDEDANVRFFLAIPREKTSLDCNTANMWLISKGLSFFTVLKYPEGYNPAPTASLVYTLIKPGDLSDETTEDILPEPAEEPVADVVEPDELDLGPTEFAIRDFYPNPFEDEVTLNFTVPQEEDLVVRVLDIVGNEVYTGAFCVNDEKNEVSFLVGPKDELNSGVYLLRVELSDRVETLRLFKE